MKNRLQILLLFVSLLTNGQKTLQDYTGTLVFKETNFYEPLTRDLADTIISYYSFDVDSTIEIEEHGFLRGDNVDFKYLKFKFIKKHDSLFISYFNPLDKKLEADYIYPLNKRDTVDERCGYKLHIDSDYVKKESGKEIYRKKISFCDDGFAYDAVYKKDTLIKFKEYTFDTYYIELMIVFNRNQIKHKRRVFIDKVSLLPIYEDEYTFAQRGRRIPLNKWVLTRRMKLITID